MSDLQKVGSGVDGWTLGASYTLINDIDAKAAAAWNGGRGFLPIGNWEEPFTGTFDGRGHVIKNLPVSRPVLVNEDSIPVGLFGVVSGGVIENVGVTGIRFLANVSDEVAGGLVGKLENGTVRRCFATGRIEAGYDEDDGGFGGLIGFCSEASVVEECYAAVGLLGSVVVGGLIGSVEDSTVRRCFATGVAAAEHDVGGLLGTAYDTVVEQCFSATRVVVIGQGECGGLIGSSWDDSAAVTDSYWDIGASGCASSAGGESRTTAQMKTQVTFAGWDFAAQWGLSAGKSYPYLRWSPPPFRFDMVQLCEGKVTRTPSGETFAVGASVTLTAAPAAGYVLYGWFGGNGATNTLKTTVVMDAPRTVAAVFARGIKTIGELQKIGNDAAYPLDAYYVLASNIDASATAAWNGGKGFAPLGTEAAPFEGTFDGRGYEIRGLTINRPQEDGVGLFGTYDDARLTNVKLVGCAVTGRDSVGGLAGRGLGHEGYWIYSEISNCSMRGSVEGRDAVGGVVGYSRGEVVSCEAVVRVGGRDQVGGVAGKSFGTVRRCRASGSVSGASCVGGLIGTGEGGWEYVDDQCSSGFGYGRAAESYATGLVKGGNNVGGLIGLCFEYRVWDCFATGPVLGEMQVGGLAGYVQSGALENVYAAGSVEGGGNVGGLVGANNAEVLGGYWDVEASGLAESAAGAGCLTAEMRQAATFEGWDFDERWGIEEAVGYPYLRAFPPPFGLLVVTQGVGRVTVSPALPAYAVGAAVRLTAQGVAGESEFVRWLGAGLNATSAVVDVTMDASRTVTAVFRAARTLGSLAEIQKIGHDPAFDLDGNYVLTNDVDASETYYWNDGAGFEPIGTEESPFTGTFDGQGHVIRNLHVARSFQGEDDVACAGLFGFVRGGTIRRLGVVGGTVQGWGSVVYAGGLVGFGAEATLEDCFTLCDVGCDAWSYAGGYGGGLAGYLTASAVSRCYALGEVRGGGEYAMLGGLLGCADSSALGECFAGGAVVSDLSAAGGLAGQVDGVVADGCYWDVEASGRTESACGEGLTASEMRQAATFGAWDFATVWSIAEGASYPYLRLFGAPFYLMTEALGPGRVTVSPLQASYAPGTLVTVTAVATPGQGEFTRWEGAGFEAETSAVVQVSMDWHRRLTAVFRSNRALGTVGDLQKIGRDAAFTSDGCYWLSADIDASATAGWNDGAGFLPLGSEEQPFTGTFDGRGHSIRNLTVDRSEIEESFVAGLFGYVGEGGEIRNLRLTGLSVAGGYEVGGLVGSLYAGTVARCFVSGTVSGAELVGGLAGRIKEGTLLECVTACLVEGGYDVGGVVGESEAGTVEACAAFGSVHGEGSVGGLAGWLGSGFVSSCFAAAQVVGQEDFGGLIGLCETEDGVEVRDSYWDVERSDCGVSGCGAGLSTVEAKRRATFAGWAFTNVWGIAEAKSYPYLQAAPAPFGLEVSVLGGGTVTKTPSAGAYAAGANVALTAKPAAGFALAEWQGVAGATGAAKLTVTMDGHRFVRAVFRRVISSVAELQKIGNDPAYPLDDYYVLNADLDAAATAKWNDGAGFAPIGSEEEPFTGTFDGRGFALKNLKIDRPGTDDVGLFARLGAGGTVKNLTLTGCSITGAARVGSVAGEAVGGAVIEKCSAEGAVTGDARVGGLVGELGGTLDGGYAQCSVAGVTSVGGLAGLVNGGTLSDCRANAVVSGDSQVGGAAGYVHDTGDVCGFSWGGYLTACRASGRVSGTRYVGGLVGLNERGGIWRCCADAAVSGSDRVGGLVGGNESYGNDNLGVVQSCYAAGTLTLASEETVAGGLIGWNGGQVYTCYAACPMVYGTEGLPPGGESAGGLIGQGYGAVESSYWDLWVSGLERSAGGEGYGTYELWWYDTFAGWDFDSGLDWGIDEGQGYPYLRAFNNYGFEGAWAEAGEADGTVTLGVRGGMSDRACSVTVSLLPGTAGLADYTQPAAAALKLNWAAGEVGVKTVTVPVKQDALVEGDEVFYAVLGSPVGGDLARSCVCEVTILDDDMSGTLATALDNTLLTWTTGGVGKWTPGEEPDAVLGSAAFSPALAAGKVSFLQGTGVSGLGWLTFRWRTASVSGPCPTLRLFDGRTLLWTSPASAEAGDSGWLDAEVEVATAVAHVFKWECVQGTDPQGWGGLDNVVWCPEGGQLIAVNLNVEAGEGGWLSGTGIYPAGTRVALEAVALPGWRFVQWDDGVTTPKRTYTVPSTPEGQVILYASFARVPYVVGLPCPPEGGKVTGGGYCLPGKTVTLKAAPEKGYTLLRWEDGSQAASRIVTAGQAEEGMGEDGVMWCTAAFGLTAQLLPPAVANPGPQEAMVGVPFSLPLEIVSDSEPGVKVTGLPSGLAYDGAARSIVGVPSVATPAGKAPAVVTVSVTNAGHTKNPSTVSFTLTVEALPAWAVGDFSGTAKGQVWRANLGDTVQLVEPAALRVDAKGKITGKLIYRGTNYTISAASYARRNVWFDNDGEGYTVERQDFSIVAEAKAGKSVLPVWLAVVHESYFDETGLLPQTLALARGGGDVAPVGVEVPELCLYRSLWKDAGMAAVATNYTGYYTATIPGADDYGSGYLAFTVDKAGGVKTAGKLADGTAVSCSGTLVLDEAGRVWTLLYLAPTGYKGGVFCGAVEFLRHEEGGIIVRPFDEYGLAWESLSPSATGAYGAGFYRKVWLSGGWYDTLINLREYYEYGLRVDGVAELPPLQATVRITDYDWESESDPRPKISWTQPTEVGPAGASPNGLVVGVTPAAGVGTGLAAPKADAPVKSPDGSYSYEFDTTGDDVVNSAGLAVSFTRATGLFKGSFNVYYDYVSAQDVTGEELKQTWTHVVKKASFEGALTPVRGDGEAEGRGFFLWPDQGLNDLLGAPLAKPFAYNRSYDFLLLRAAW